MILVPFINSIRYTKLVPDMVPQYLSKHMDDWRFPDTIKPWEQPAYYCQPWVYSDSIRQQVQSDVGPLRLRLYDYTGKVWFDDNFLQMQASLNMPDMFIYQSDLALSVVTVPGLYYLRLDIGSPVGSTWISDDLYIAPGIDDTLLFEFTNSRFYCDTIFENGFSPRVRTYGRLKPKAPASRDNVYEDQVLNMTMLNSKPYRLWELQLSAASGIPPWFIHKLNWVLGCDDLKIDGRAYTKNEGAKLEESAVPGYPMFGYTIEMREKLNRSSMVIEDDSAQFDVAAVVANTDSKGFGQDDSGGSVYQIIDVN